MPYVFRLSDLPKLDLQVDCGTDFEAWKAPTQRCQASVVSQLIPRLQKLKSHLMGYSFTAKWIKGKGNNVPDALSHNTVSDPQWNDTLA